MKESQMKKITYKEISKARIDAFLGKASEYSRSEITRLINKGLIRNNDKMVLKSSEKVETGDIIIIDNESTNAKILSPYKLNLNIKYEDEDLVIISKKEGLVVHPSKTYKGITLASGLIEKFPEIINVGEKERPGIVHRLDKETSGLMVIAKNESSYNALKLMFKSRKIKKEYVAVVRGVTKKNGIIDAPIGRHPINKIKRTLISSGKSALTSYSKIDQSLNLSMLKVKIFTGRTHQIRVHLNSIGHPILGDNLYSRNKENNSRLFLHSIRLKFIHPIKNTEIDINEKIPNNFAEVLRKTII